MAGINSGTASIYHLILKRGKSNPIIPVNHIAMPAAGTRLPRCPNSWGSPGCPDQLGFMGGLVRNGIKGTICILYKYNSQPLSLIVNCTPFIYFCLFFFCTFYGSLPNVATWRCLRLVVGAFLSVQPSFSLNFDPYDLWPMKNCLWRSFYTSYGLKRLAGRLIYQTPTLSLSLASLFFPIAQ